MYRPLLVFLTALLTLASCGVDGNRFKLEGRILNMNQGEFYIYDDEGIIDGIDTIKVVGGRFTYEMACERPTTAMLVFPNFSEQPIFVEPGNAVEVEGDASNLKMLKVTGTKTNEIMSDFREQIATASPPEARKYAVQLVEDHPELPIGVYLVRKYLMAAAEPDPREAARLVALMVPEQPANSQLKRMQTLVKEAARARIGAVLPTFTAYDTKGRLVSSADLSTGLTIINSWASWNYESIDQLRTINRIRRQSGGRLKVVSVSVDASRYECRQSLDRDTIAWPVVCDGTMLDNKMLRLLGLSSLPDNVLVKNGKIIARSVPTHDLQAKIEANL